MKPHASRNTACAARQELDALERAYAEWRTVAPEDADLCGELLDKWVVKLCEARWRAAFADREMAADRSKIEKVP